MEREGKCVCVCVRARERERVSEGGGEESSSSGSAASSLYRHYSRKEKQFTVYLLHLSLSLTLMTTHLSIFTHTLEVDQPPLSLTRRAPSDIIHHLWMFALPASRIPGHCLLMKICVLMTRG